MNIDEQKLSEQSSSSFLDSNQPSRSQSTEENTQSMQLANLATPIKQNKDIIISNDVSNIASVELSNDISKLSITSKSISSDTSYTNTYISQKVSQNSLLIQDYDTFNFREIDPSEYPVSQVNFSQKQFIAKSAQTVEKLCSLLNQITVEIIDLTGKLQ